MDRLLRQLESFGEAAKDKAGVEVKDTADEIQKLAIDNVKSHGANNFGKLIQGIQPERKNDLQFNVIAKEDYSGYVEFGTGVKTVVPAEMKDIANAIKNNPKGDLKLALKSVQDWCRGKGIDERAAWPILMSVLDEGLRPRPFLYPAWKKGTASMIKRLEKQVEREVKRFNAAK